MKLLHLDLYTSMTEAARRAFVFVGWSERSDEQNYLINLIWFTGNETEASGPTAGAVVCLTFLKRCYCGEVSVADTVSIWIFSDDAAH